MVEPYYDISHYNIISIEGVSNVLVGLTLFSIFLAVFYFTYASKIEQDILDIQVKNLINDLTSDMSALPNDINEQLRSIIRTMPVSDLSKEDEEVKNANNKLIGNTMVAFGSFTALTIIIVTIFLYLYKVDIKDIIITNLIVLLFIAITEALFLNLIAKSYRSLDPNDIKLNIIKKIQSFQKS
jgi:hypothetical protein